jgi:hypothetical protein
MNETIQQVLEWLMKNSELLATEAFKAAKTQVIVSSTVWLWVGIVVSVVLLLVGVFGIFAQFKWWMDSSDGGVFAAGCLLILLSIIVAVLTIPDNLVKLNSSDWYAVQLIMQTIGQLR